MSPNLKNLMEELSEALRKHNACIYIRADYSLVIEMPGKQIHGIGKFYVGKDHIDADCLDGLLDSSYVNDID